MEPRKQHDTRETFYEPRLVDRFDAGAAGKQQFAEATGAPAASSAIAAVRGLYRPRRQRTTAAASRVVTAVAATDAAAAAIVAPAAATVAAGTPQYRQTYA